MKKTILLLLTSLFSLSLSAEEIPFGYYDAINGKQYSVLKSTLSQIVRGGERYEYGTNQYHSTSNPPEWQKGDFKAYGTWQALPFTDHKPGTQGGVWDMYSNCVRYYPNKLGDSGCSLNIEHCLPKSWWGGEENEAYKDLYNLNPSDQRANSQKSNYAPGHVTKGDKFNNGSFKMDAAKSSRYGYICWEPAEEYRGDFARTYFYMATAYEYLTWTAYAQYISGANYLMFSDSIQKVLLDWHRADPISDKELCRAEPLTIELSMYGGFEQVGPIGARLPSSDVQTTTRAGDIVLYSSNQMVVFYGSNSWAYTRLGHISDQSAEDMAALLGHGDVSVTLWLEAEG